MDLEPDAVAQAMAEVLAVARRVDDLARHGIDLAAGRPRTDRVQRLPLRLQHDLVDRELFRAGQRAGGEACACSRSSSRPAARPQSMTTSVPAGISTSRGSACGSAPCSPATIGGNEAACAPMRRMVNSRSSATSRSVRPASPRLEHLVQRVVGELGRGADRRQLARRP